MKLGKHQKAHFSRMSAEERRECIRDCERQMGVISFSTTDAAERKRSELQARIDFLLQLNRGRRAL